MRHRIAVIGSRDWARPLDVRDFIAELPRHALIISGGARGVDEAAEDEARRLRLARLILPPLCALDAPRAVHVAALHARNDEILKYAQRVVAFWDGSSRGTGGVIEKARALGLPVDIRR